MKTQNKTTVKQFKEELIASIQNEKRHFDMSTFTTMDSDDEDTKPGQLQDSLLYGGAY